MAHEVDLYFNRSALAFVNHVDILGLDDADILSLTTVDGLVTAIGNETAMHEVDTKIRDQAKQAVKAAGNVGYITNAEVAAADTMAGLKAVFTAEDSSLSATEDRSFGYISVNL